MVRRLAPLFVLLSLAAACGEVKGPTQELPDAAETGAPDAGVDAAPPAACGAGGSTCADGSTCFENVCGGARVVQVSNWCLVRASGSVWCWGGNTYGVSGDPSTSSLQCSTRPCNPTPVRVDRLTDVVQVSDYGDNACAVKRDGTVWCWGVNNVGQLGHDPATDNQKCAGLPCTTTPTVVPGLADVTQVATRYGTTCALSRGLVYCWGDNTTRQLGRGTSTESSHIPATVSGVTKATQISVGKLSACARREDSTVVCWGWNAWGQLGHPLTGDAKCGNDACNGQPLPVVDKIGVALGDITSVTIGDAHTCAIRASGELWCWGHGGYCQLGDALNNTIANPEPVKIAGLTQVVEVGTMHSTCARLNSGQVWCLGLKFLGALGDGERVSATVSAAGGHACSTKPVRAGTVLAAGISTTWDNTTALGQNGKVYAWGNNNDAQLGHAPGTAGDETCVVSDTCNTSPVEIPIP